MCIQAPKLLQARMRSITYLKATDETNKRDPYITEVRFLQPALDDSRGCFVVIRHEFTADDGSADGLCGVDDFFDSRDAESYIHRCHPSKVECFQSHLGPWLSN